MLVSITTTVCKALSNPRVIHLLCAKKHSIRGRQAMVLQGSVGLKYSGLATLHDLGYSTPP